MKVLLEKGLWIGRVTLTLIESDAREFNSIEDAQEALRSAREDESYPNAMIAEDLF